MSPLFYSVGALIVLFLLMKAFPYLYFFAGATGAFFRMGRKQKKSCSLPEDVVEVRDGYVSAWLIRGDGGWIAVDAGQHAGAVNTVLKKNGLSPSDVKHLFLTHTDVDHVGAIRSFPDAAVYLASAEEPMINGTGKRTFTRYGISFGGNRLKVPYTTLEDMQELNLSGRKIECILTPGHTPGSMCFLVDDRYIFTGDALSLEEGSFTRFIPLFSMDVEESQLSIAKLVGTVRNRSVEYVFTGHDRCTDDFGRASEGWYNVHD